MSRAAHTAVIAWLCTQPSCQRERPTTDEPTVAIPPRLPSDVRVTKYCYLEHRDGCVRHLSHDCIDRHAWTTYDLQRGTFNSASAPSGTLADNKLARIRERFAELVAGGPYTTHPPRKDQLRCALLLHRGDLATPLFRVDRIGFAKDDEVTALLNEL